MSWVAPFYTTVEEELDYIDIDDIGNLEDSPILVLLMRNVGMYHSST